MSKKYVTGANPKTSARDSRNGRFVIGREGMVKLNAIEGISQSRSSREMFAEFDRDGASPEERRRRIIAKHARKG